MNFRVSLVETRHLLEIRRLLEHWPRAPQRLLMSFVPMFPVYINFTLHVNSRRFCLQWLAKDEELSVSIKCWG